MAEMLLPLVRGEGPDTVFSFEMFGIRTYFSFQNCFGADTTHNSMAEHVLHPVGPEFFSSAKTRERSDSSEGEAGQFWATKGPSSPNRSPQEP